MNPPKFDWKNTIKFNIVFLKISGFWPQQNGSYNLNVLSLRTILQVSIFVLIGLLCQIIKLFFIFDDLLEFTALIYVVTTEVLFVFKIYFMTKNMSTLKTLMEMLNNDLFQPQDTKQISLITPNLDFWKMIFKAFMGMCCGANLFWAVFPLLDKSNEGKRLPFLAWYPYNAKISPFYEITYVHQVLSYTYTCFTHLNVDTFIAALNMYIASQFDILCDNLRKLHLCKDVDKKFIKCVKHHWLILSFAKNANHFFNWIIFMQFCVSSTITAVTLFQLTIVTPLTTEFFSFMSFGMAAVIQIFMFSWFGNEIEVKSKMVPYAIYESNWPNFSLKTQKNILFFILKAQKPVKMSAHNVFYLSVESFMKILKTSWSYFALLQQLSS